MFIERMGREQNFFSDINTFLKHLTENKIKYWVSKSYHNSRADTSLSFYLSGSKTSIYVVVSWSVQCLKFWKKQKTKKTTKKKNKTKRKTPSQYFLLTCTLNYWQCSSSLLSRINLPEATNLTRDLRQPAASQSMMGPKPVGRAWQEKPKYMQSWRTKNLS